MRGLDHGGAKRARNAKREVAKMSARRQLRDLGTYAIEPDILKGAVDLSGLALGMRDGRASRPDRSVAEKRGKYGYQNHPR